MSPTPDPDHEPAGASGSGATLLSARGIRTSFGDTEVLRGVDLDVRRGRVTVLIGPSGSGKTTLLRALNALTPPDAGVIETDGVAIDFAARASAREKRVQRARLRDGAGMVFQHYDLFPHKTALENAVEGPVVVQGRPRAEVEAEVRSLFARVGLAGREGSYPFQLSGGQRQRVGIVRALALRPRLLLFDEPTSALDPETVGDVLVIMKELADEGWTMVVVTHELGFAREVADEVLFLDGGVIVEQGPPDRVFTRPERPRTREFLDRLLRPLDGS